MNSPDKPQPGQPESGASLSPVEAAEAILAAALDDLSRETNPDEWLAIVHNDDVHTILTLTFRPENIVRIQTSPHVRPGEVILVNLTQLPDWGTPDDLKEQS